MAALRLKEKYSESVVPALREEFGYGSPMAVPRLVAIKLNVGIGKIILQKQDGGQKKKAAKA
ncbi:MAG: hypothetical protein OXB91_05155, partial [Bryobacterales bacterium]|nr:hypothetical protein [Bryobacterales bacterium]